ncbi:Other 1 kinase [Mycena sanguinolenta]|uniref:Other 1 kinase n=1 Tax=Mycena sanguinolenta TaxID=230812 RepID=A0A8H7CLU2_9AGAR|nr:Other 1 kinase [Mycena sanguinolenta]
MTTTIHQPPRLITELSTAVELGEAFRDIFQSYRALHEKSGVTHGDIGIHNLRYRKKDGQTRGVLVDLDEMENPKRLNPATRPYMARDLLYPGPPPLHLYRFDLESLLYTMVIVLCSYENGQEIENPPFETWEELETDALLTEKIIFFGGPVPMPTVNFIDIYGVNRALSKLFRDGCHARIDATLFDNSLDPTFDNDTLGGHVTFDTFERILDEHLPR